MLLILVTLLPKKDTNSLWLLVVLVNVRYLRWQDGFTGVTDFHVAVLQVASKEFFPVTRSMIVFSAHVNVYAVACSK